MKLPLLFAVLITLILQSCTINTDITYYKDATTTSTVEIDMQEMMDMLQDLAKDSTSSNPIKDFENLPPKEWTSFYEIQRKEGTVTQNPDTIRLMKKTFMKSNFIDGKLSGIAVKMDRFSKADYENFSINRPEKLPFENQTFVDWDGKKLSINLEDLSFTKMFEKTKQEDADQEDLINQLEEAKSMMEMMDMKFSTTLHFENKVKSIIGNNSRIKKIDDNTIQINIDKDLLLEDDKSPQKSKDNIITILTE